jgi:hypothetical protein
MAQKKSFVLRINPEALKALEEWANDEFRSVNGQIEYLLQKALKEHGREPKVKTSSVAEQNPEKTTKHKPL